MLNPLAKFFEDWSIAKYVYGFYQAMNEISVVGERTKQSIKSKVEKYFMLDCT